MTFLCACPSNARQIAIETVRVRMRGHAARAALVRDVAAPAVACGDALTPHAVRLLADGVASHDVHIAADPALTHVAPRRLTGYLAGRYCAARALIAAGYEDTPIAVGDAGAPAWPAGVVGSISHSPIRALAVIGSAQRWRSIGVDCEPVLDAHAADAIVRDTIPEADAVDVSGNGAITWPEFVTVGFSAKESLYKCLRPIVGQFFDFGDAHLTHLDRDTRRVRLCLTRDLAPGFGRRTAFDVAFDLSDAHAHTCLTLPVINAPAALEFVS